MASPGLRSRSVLKPRPIIVTDSELTMYSVKPFSSLLEPQQIGRMPQGSRKASMPLPAITATQA